MIQLEKQQFGENVVYSVQFIAENRVKMKHITTQLSFEMERRLSYLSNLRGSVEVYES